MRSENLISRTSCFFYSTDSLKPAHNLFRSRFGRMYHLCNCIGAFSCRHPGGPEAKPEVGYAEPGSLVHSIGFARNFLPIRGFIRARPVTDRLLRTGGLITVPRFGFVPQDPRIRFGMSGVLQPFEIFRRQTRMCPDRIPRSNPSSESSSVFVTRVCEAIRIFVQPDQRMYSQRLVQNINILTTGKQY